jgi:putative endonuclease
MHYVYVLRSLKDGKLYTGYAEDLQRRLEEHNTGKIQSTRFRTPFEIVYYEAGRNQKDALHREKYLITSYGKRYIKGRIKHDFPF